ncbi:hypothetical protein BKA62DRAFT_686909 [Auriculariales sp. MPI-PUGE-AT-0066]|nr:hypothetical protein BKA62DRAFT_686909 [Auriculariales sp. MPI-PUGE-AT-0066]
MWHGTNTRFASASCPLPHASMGVKGLWKLVGPAGRPVLLETAEGKAMAIDSSIWLYQFQATMRDKNGEALTNAHILGFLRRICKLLFYGIRPVFVFDGGAPVLKRSTIIERKNRKAGVAASHAKIAEKLLAAQMRREALNAAGVRPTSRSKQPILDENTVFLEDMLLPEARGAIPKLTTAPTMSLPKAPAPKPKPVVHDPYHLPDVDVEAAVAEAAHLAVPDPRLATEEELRAFIEHMRPEDLDITSEAFRDLPTEVKYEIIGDLRLKSRQTSYKRLQSMLRAAPTAMDFSKAQIKFLQQRNNLTQQMLETTDNISNAFVNIPVRIASERNRQYVLMKNEGPEGGWVLGRRDDGTIAKPIEIDHEPVQVDDSDDEMEEVSVSSQPAPDPDLRDYRRHMGLSAIGVRQSPTKSTPAALSSSRRVSAKKQRKEHPLFVPDEDERFLDIQDMESDDPELAAAIFESLETEHSRQAKESSKSTSPPRPTSTSSRLTLANAIISMSVLPSNSGSTSAIIQAVDNDDDPAAMQRQLHADAAELGLAQANSASTKPSFGKASLLRDPSPSQDDSFTLPTQVRRSEKPPLSAQPRLGSRFAIAAIQDPPLPLSRGRTSEELSPVMFRQFAAPSSPVTSLPVIEVTTEPYEIIEDDHIEEDDMEDVLPSPLQLSTRQESDDDDMEEVVVSNDTFSSTIDAEGELLEDMGSSEAAQESNEPLATSSQHADSADAQRNALFRESDDRDVRDTREWSPTPVVLEDQEDEEGHWDAAQEMDIQAEESGFAQFLSQVKGRDLGSVREEIDAEIDELNKQRRAAQRDSEDITQQMTSQIMVLLRLFGIPYITAPMEAEAQCATLVELGLCDGVITDDSDVFLFGSPRVFKNMFNQSKTVEVFLATDLVRDLGLDRDKLIRLAYLLGSDYVEGLPGVGPVLAMELLAEFPGHDGLHKFKEWWVKVQSGKDKQEDTNSAFRKRFKRKFKTLHLPSEWPNPVVRDAYYHPTVDSSEEQFKWGLPDLDALQHFLGQELGWSTEKVDELVLPVIHKMGQRKTAANASKQSDLVAYFDTTGGTGTYSPRKKQAYASKRLQKIVSDYRKERREKGLTPGRSPAPDGATDGPSAPAKRKRKTSRAKKSTTPTEEELAPPAKKKRSRAQPKKQANRSDEDEVQGSVTSDAVPDRGLRLRRSVATARAIIESDSDAEDA